MAQQPMYPGMIGSPTTTLTAAISGSATSFSVVNGNALPEAPNLATLGSGQNAEIVLYSTKSGNTLSGVTRGFQGSAQPHESGTLVSRRLTAYDLDALRQNHEALVAQRGAANGVASLDATGTIPVSQLLDGSIADIKLSSDTTQIKARVGVLQDKFPDNSGAHNSIYRGKFLGTSYTTAQQAAVAAGTFKDLYIGDFWTIGDVNYRIAAFNYFRNVGDTGLFTNHITIVPDTILYDALMNATATSDGGYVNSEMRTANLAAAIATIEAAFPGRVVTHQQMLVNAVTDGRASGWVWVSASVELMNEFMVYGASAWGVSSTGNGFNVGSSNGRLPLFSYRQDLVNTRQTYWLRDVTSSTSFVFADSLGSASTRFAFNSHGVRPAFSIS